jgi:hypothetical protein
MIYDQLCNFITTHYGGEAVETLRWCGLSGNRAAFILPKTVHMYNLNMNAVDKAMSATNLFAWPYKCNKWTKAAFFALINIAVQNAKIIWSKVTGWKGSQREWMECLLRCIVKKYGFKNSNLEKHYIMSQKTEKKTCKYCSKRCEYQCKCGVPLHHKCFAQHDVQNLKSTRSPKKKK